jgi:hypothetical protein
MFKHVQQCKNLTNEGNVSPLCFLGNEDCCYNGEGGGCGGEEVAGQSEANAAGRWCDKGPGHGWTVDWLSVALEDGS